MGLLLVFILCLAIGQTLSIFVGLAVERYTSPYTGLVTFIVGYFAMFWFMWKLAVWLTVPGKRLGHFLTGEPRSRPDRPAHFLRGGAGGGGPGRGSY